MALNIATGVEVWSRPRAERGPSWASPIIAFVGNTPKLILVGGRHITAYNPSTGEQLWRVDDVLGGEPGASAASANGIIFAAADYAKLVAINGANGTVLWEDNWYLPDASSPVATRDNLFITATWGSFVAYDTQTGEIRKEHELSPPFYSSAMIADGKIFLINRDGRVYIFTADNDFRLLESFDSGEKTDGTPAFADGKIVIRGERYLYCVAVR
jgi:outer membrane protein assembly factor BamB